MLKKLIIAVALLGLLTVSAQAKTLIFGGMQVPIPGADTHKIGAGTMFAIGQEISDKLIVWGNANASKFTLKTGEGVSMDNGLVGISLLSDKLFGAGGFYFTLEGGLGKIEGQKVKFSNLIGGGCFLDLSKETRLWLGAGQSNTGDITIFSIQAGLSMGVDWK